MQEVIGSTPIFSTPEKHYQSSSYGLFRSCFFVCPESRCKHGVNKPYKMVTEDSLSGMDHATFERFVFRYVSSIKRFILSSNPNATDPDYVLYSNIKDWGMNFIHGVKRQNLSLTIETLYRTGATI